MDANGSQHVWSLILLVASCHSTLVKSARLNLRATDGLVGSGLHYSHYRLQGPACWHGLVALGPARQKFAAALVKNDYNG